MRKIVSFLVTILFFNISFGQITFQKTYDEYIIICVKQTTDSGYVATGLEPGGSTIAFLKTNEFGDSLWSKSFDNGSCSGNSVSQTADGGYIIAGEGGNPYSIIIVRTNSNGDTLWTKDYTGSGFTKGSVAIETIDSGLIILGTTNGTSITDDICLIKTNPTGDIAWTKTFSHPPAWSVGVSILQTSDSGYVLAGLSNNKMILISTNNLGDTLWTREYADSNALCQQMKRTPDNGFILVGGDANGMLVIKTDSLGNLMWSKNYGQQNHQFVMCEGVDITSDGGFIFSGFRNDSSSGFGFVIRTDSVGDTLWSRMYKSPNVSIFSVVRAFDDGFILGGANSFFSELIKIDPNGQSGCNESADNFIITAPPTVVSNLNITFPATQFSVGNPGLQVLSGNAYAILCSSVNVPEFPDFKANISISPNPASNLAVINSDYEINSIEIYSSIGEKALEINSFRGAHKSEVNTGSLTSGFYFVKVSTQYENVVRKLIIEK